MAHVLWILPVLFFIGIPGKTLANDKFVVESSSQEIIYDETGRQATTLSYTIQPWPPDWRSNSSDYEAYKDVKIEFYNDTSSALLCQARYYKGQWVNESLTDSCRLRSRGRVEDFEPSHNEWVSFTITGVTLWDMGTYQLVVTDFFKETYRGTMNLTVKARPLPEVTPSPVGDLEEGQQVDLTCSTRNTWPPPSLQWTRGLKPLDSQKSISTTWDGESWAKLTWKARKDDHGQAFVCTASNDAGDSRTASYSMSVLFVPEITIASCTNGYAVLESKQATLMCQINAYPGFSLTRWSSPTGGVLQTNQTRLEINNIVRGQSGNYTCTATNAKGTGTKSCSVDVHYGVTVKLPTSVTFKEHQEVNILCETEGNPEAVEYSWKLRERSEVVSTNKTLVFTAVRPENGGIYTCSASNYPAGNQPWTDTGQVQLLVQYKPRLANYALTKFAGHIGQTATLECWAHGYPAPKVSWIFNGRDVINDSRHVIENSQSVSRLRVKMVHDTDYGDYTCSALNSEGGERFGIHLLEPGKPDPPQSCDVTKVTDREVALTCVQGYDGGDLLTFSVSRSVEGQQGSDWSEVEVTIPEIYALWTAGQPIVHLKVKGFGPNTNYTLKVYGDNKYGKSEAALTVAIRTADGPPLPTPAPPPVGAIVGGVLGGLLVVAIVVGAALYVRKYGAPEVPTVMRRKPRDDRRNIMNRYSDDVGRRYADRMSWTPDDNQKEAHIRASVAEPNTYVLHPGMNQEPHRGYTQRNTAYRDEEDYRDYGNHGNNGNEAAGNDYSEGAYGYDGDYGNENGGYENGGFEDGQEEYADQYAQEYGGYMNVDNNRQDIQVAAEVYNPVVLRHNRNDSSTHAQDQRPRQSNLAGMGALAGSHVMLHAQQEGQTGYGHDDRKRRSQEPLMEGLSSLENRWEYPRHQLSFRERLGEGLFGEVWRCYADNLGGRHGRLNVAVKLLKASCPPEEQSSLSRELEVLKMLRPHPNVVALLGACTEKDPLFVILEYCSKGNLLDFLRTNRSIPRGMHPAVRGVTLTTRSLTCYIMQIANGMEFISTNGLLHRDLACRNILLDDRLTCKISDFGFARDIAHTRQYEGKTRRRLPLRWMAPESLYDCLYSTNSDVWAFGVLIWEVMTLGSSPYPGLTGHDVMELVNTGFRMEKPLHCSSSMYSVMRDCWRPVAHQRPSWSSLSMRIAAILEDLDDNPEEIIRVNVMEGSMFAILTNPPGEKC